MLRRVLVSLVLVTALAPGCLGTPIPQPPVLDAPDGDLIAYEMVGSVSELVGQPGAALPDSTLWVVNLDGTGDPLTAPVSSDGSFTVSLFAAPGDVLRVQVRDGADRSRPVDVLVPRGTVVRPTEGCLELDPPLELRLAEAVAVGASVTATIEVTNGCGADARIDAVALRRPSDAWSVDTAGPIMVPSGGTAEVRLTFRPASVGSHEEIVFLSVSAPETDRRPVTLSGEGS